MGSRSGLIYGRYSSLYLIDQRWCYKAAFFLLAFGCKILRFLHQQPTFLEMSFSNPLIIKEFLYLMLMITLHGSIHLETYTNMAVQSPP